MENEKFTDEFIMFFQILMNNSTEHDQRFFHSLLDSSE